MRKGWQTTTLGAAFETVTGNTPPKNNADFYGQFMPLVKPPELCDATLDSAEDGISEAGAEVGRTAPPNSILVSCIGNLGKVGLNIVPVAFNQQINAILPDTRKAIPEFVFYQVLSSLFKEQLRALASGTTVPIVNKSKFNGIEIVLPPLPEQKRIVTILDEAFEGISAAVANAEKNLANARELFETYLNSVFTRNGEGRVKKKLGEIGKTQYGLSEKMNEDGVGYKIFRMGEVQNGQLIDTGTMKYADITREEFEKYKLRRGDVLFNRTNSFELVGKTGIFNLDGDYCFASYLVRLKLDRGKMIPEFLNYFMNSSIFQDSVKQKASRSINQANINATILSNENIQFPEAICDQQAIVGKFDELSSETQRLQATYERKLDCLAELKQAILQKAFAGELTAQPEKALRKAAAA